MTAVMHNCRYIAHLVFGSLSLKAVSLFKDHAFLCVCQLLSLAVFSNAMLCLFSIHHSAKRSFYNPNPKNSHLIFTLILSPEF